MKSKKLIVYVPGFTEINQGSWPSWLEKELAKYGFDFMFMDMPNVVYPELHEWLDFLESKKLKINKNVYFIGHSLGCITIARYLENKPKNAIASACIFVAGFCTLPKFPLLSNFCTDPLDFSKVQKHAEDFVVVMSDNDRIIPNNDSLELAEKLNANVMIEHNKGHFTAELKELHSVLNYIIEKELMKKELQEMKRLRK